ncbi:MAG: SIR2 family protein, partial [Candidatus Sumerlaeota bacterium]|nr:SIR2 family protein [Candidatus Sumerlaeota bacterium]
VTTNYDPLLSVAAVQNGCHQLYHYPDLPIMPLGGSDRPIYYIHGLARIRDKPCGDYLVLSKSEFDEAYSGIVRTFLEMLFAYHPVLFLGCRLSENQIREILIKAGNFQNKINSARSKNIVPCKIILLSPKEFRERTELGEDQIDHGKTESVFIQEMRRFEELGLKVMRYDPEGQGHREIEAILDELCNLYNISTSLEPNFGLSEDLPKP